MQSMTKPELLPGGIPHGRRFVSIEHELADLSVSNKLLSKRVELLEKRLSRCWALAIFSALLAALSLMV